MTQFDVFNGDADGICALHQLRLERPTDAALITGVKRDIKLLERVQAEPGDSVIALDISLDRNRAALESLLENGVRVFYVDHHFAGEIPDHPGLEALIDTAPEVCTSLLINGYLKGKYLPWAVTAAFGDNLFASAKRAAAALALTDVQLTALQELGTCINYNGYGSSVEDLYFHPAELYRKIRPHADPFQFIADEPAYRTLREGYAADMERAQALKPEFATESHALYILPQAAWTRRVSGVFGNQLARRDPRRAHAVLTLKSEGGLVVSVRAPLTTRKGADELCRSFPSGGGREAAAGINHLPEDQLEQFARAFRQAFA